MYASETECGRSAECAPLQPVRPAPGLTSAPRPQRRADKAEVAAWYIGAAGLALGHTLAAQLIVLGCRLYRFVIDPDARRLRPSPADVPLLALAGWMLFSAFFALKPSNAFGSTAGAMLTGWLVLSSVRNLVADRTGAGARVMRFFVYAAAGGSVYALVRFAVRLPQWEGGVRGELPFVGANATGTILAVATLVSLATVASAEAPGSARRKERAWLLAAAALTFSGVIATQCRGALVALAAGLLVLCFRQRRQRRNVLAVAVAFALVTALFAAVYPPMRARVASIVSLGSNADRLEIWKTALLVIRDHPIVGVGVNNFRRAYVSYPHPAHYREQHLFAHNIFLEFGAATGVPGLLLVLWVVVVALRRALKAWNREVNGIRGPVFLAAFMALLVHLQFDITIYSMDMLPLFFTTYGVLAALGEGG